jgi:hypothetical protein
LAKVEVVPGGCVLYGLARWQQLPVQATLGWTTGWQVKSLTCLPFRED